MLRTSMLLLLTLFVGSALSVVGAEDEPSGTALAYEPFLPGTAPENVVSVRVLALNDGRPVPVKGARVSGWSEESFVSSRLLADGVSDEYGFVNLTWPPDGERPFHWLAEAPGKAVRALQPSGDVFLSQGAPYPVRVLSSMGEPLPGARIEYFIYGCPHSPAARHGTTDAEGNIVLGGLPVSTDLDEWGQFWIVAEGVEPGPYGAPGRRTDGKPAVRLTSVGRSAHGFVRNEDGQPMAGVSVGEMGYPRGPLTRTDAEGRFRLIGLSSTGGIGFYDSRDPRDGRPNAVVKDFEPDVPIRLVLRRGRACALGQGEAREVVEVEVLQRYSPEAPPSTANDVPVRLVRLSDGLLIAGKTGDPSHGLYRTLLPLGRYRVIVGGGFSSVIHATKEIDVPAAEPVRFVLDMAASLSLRGLDPHDEEWVGLRLPSGSETATGRLGHSLNLPPDGPALIHLERGGPVILPVGPLEDGFRRATVPKPDLAIVRFRVRSADPDQPLEWAEVTWADDRRGEEEEGEADDEGRWTLSTHRRGQRAITTWAQGFQNETIVVPLRPQDREINLGDILLQPLCSRTLRVLDSDGTVVRDLSLHWGIRGEMGNELQEDDGTFALELGPRPAPGVIRGEGIYPHPVLLGVKGSDEVRLPGGRLVIRVRDTKGLPLKSAAYLDHVRVPFGEGEHALRGVPEGTHTVIVGAPGHVGAVRSIRMGKTEARTVEFTLSPR